MRLCANGRAQAEMDLTVAGPPPQRRPALDIL